MENRLDVNVNIDGISKEGSTCLSGSFGNEKHFLEESALLPSLRYNECKKMKFSFIAKVQKIWGSEVML